MRLFLELSLFLLSSARRSRLDNLRRNVMIIRDTWSFLVFHVDREIDAFDPVINFVA